MNPEILDKVEKSLTPTERRLYNLFKDGDFHTAEELIIKGLQDELCEKSTLNYHLCALRGKLRMADMDILGQSRGRWPVKYKMVILITTASLAKLRSQ